MIFVDTGAWYALFIKSDQRHKSARAWREQNRAAILVTSDYVVAELLNLLVARGQTRRIPRVASELISPEGRALLRITPEDFASAAKLLQNRSDKLWSFTDCTSLVVMERLGIKTAFAFDEHFRQFGTVSVVP